MAIVTDRSKDLFLNDETAVADEDLTKFDNCVFLRIQRISIKFLSLRKGRCQNRHP